MLTSLAQYYTLKLIFLAYLAHPQTRGALKLHESVFRPLLARASAPTSSAYTPPTSKPSTSSASSPNPFTNKGYDTGSSGSQPSSNAGTVQLPSGGGTGVGLQIPNDSATGLDGGVTGPSGSLGAGMANDTRSQSAY